MRISPVLVASILSLSLAFPSSSLAQSPEEGEAEAEGEGEEEEVDEAKFEEAKKLYQQAEKAAKKKKWKQAMELYEQAYYLVPGKHGFAFKVGEAAQKAGDCTKSLEYLLHFFQYSDVEKHADLQAQARGLLKEMLDKECVREDELNNYHLSPDEREEKSFALYKQAEEHAAAEEWVEATKLYEEAYYLVPSKIGFAHKVGMAAYKTEDCDKAHEYLVHFVDYGDPAKHGEKMAEATKIIRELESSGCVSGQEMEAHSLENPFEITHENLDKKDEKQKGGNGLLIGGAALVGVGVAGIGVGIVGFVLAGSSQSNLDALAAAGPSGYSDADYACRDVPTNECPPKLENQIGARKALGVIGVSIGGAALLGGAALIALHFVRKGKGGGKNARLDGVAPMLVSGGGGAAAQLRF